MAKRFVWIIILALLFFGGCRRNADDAERVEPVGTIRSEPIPVTFPTLNADPFTFLNRLIRVSGRYSPPIPAGCFPFTGPQRNWGLVAEGFEMSINGLAQVTRVAQEGEILTIDGIWRRYEGPVGCGDKTEMNTIWYLDVQQVVSPNPIGGILVANEIDGATEAGQTTSAAVGNQAAVTPIPSVTPIPLESPTPDGGLAGTAPAVSPTASRTPTPAGVNASSTPSLTPTFTLRPRTGRETPSLTPSPTATSDPNMTATPGGSSGGLGESGSGTRTPATPDATATSGGYQSEPTAYP